MLIEHSGVYYNRGVGHQEVSISGEDETNFLKEESRKPEFLSETMYPKLFLYQSLKPKRIKMIKYQYTYYTCKLV